MNHCECGMTLDRPAASHGCRDCGTNICRSCGVEVEAHAYCRWCATSLGLARVA